MKPNLLTLFLAICFSFHAQSQNENWIWARHSGGTFNEARGNGVAVDAQGNVYVSGAYSCAQLTFGNFTIVNNGGDDMFLVKFDSAGNALWAVTAGDDYAEECSGVAVDLAGNVYITGEFWSASVTFGNYTITNSGSADVFIVKYDADGNALWAKSASGADEDHCNGITTDISGNVYITGSFSSSAITFDNTTLNNNQSGSEDLFVTKYDADGNVVWAMNPVGFDRDQGFALATDLNQDVYLTGNFRSSQLIFGNVTINNSGGDDMFIAKFDSLGNALWAHNATGFSYDYGFAIAVDLYSNAYVAGQFESSPLTFGNTSINNSGVDDIFVAKYNADGDALWAHDAGGSSYDYGYGIAVDKASNVYTTGNFGSPVLSFGNISLANHASSGYDFFIAKYDSSGMVQWVQNDVSSEYAYSNNCAADADGNLFVTGLYGASSMTLDTIVLTTDAYDMFIAKYGHSVCSNIFYADADSDGYGNHELTAIACTAPAGYVSDSTDCNDSNASINPGATEIPNNGIDENCDGVDGVPTEVAMIATDTDGISLYPNPATNEFVITFSSACLGKKATIQLTDLFGKVIYSQNIFIGKNELKKIIRFNSAMADGEYLVRVNLNDRVLTQSLIIQK